MKDYTNKIEKYLRGQMSQEEEKTFKEKIISDSFFSSSALLIVQLLKYLNKTQSIHKIIKNHH